MMKKVRKVNLGDFFERNYSFDNPKILTREINNLSIRLSGDEYKCCFDVLVNGMVLVSSLTLGELLELIARVFQTKNHSICYLDDFGKFDFV